MSLLTCSTTKEEVPLGDGDFLIISHYFYTQHEGEHKLVFLKETSENRTNKTCNSGKKQETFIPYINCEVKLDKNSFFLTEQLQNIFLARYGHSV